jgi:hypothetical protein
VTEVRLEGIHLLSRGGGTAADAARSVPEMVRDYPEPMLFGPLPAWGLYARHVAGLHLRDITLRLQSPDARPAVMLDDVSGLTARDCDGLPDTRHAGL